MNRGERIAEKEKELKGARREMAELDEMIRGLTERRTNVFRQAKRLENDLQQMKPRDLQVSDHAVLRYMERNHGIDVEGVRKLIHEEMAGAENFGALKFRGFVVKGNTVVTYVPPTKDSSALPDQS